VRPPRLVALAFTLSLAFGGLSLGYAQNSTPDAATVAQSPNTAGLLQLWIKAGSLPDLRWPNFSDYQAHVTNFYAPPNYAPQWLNSSIPTPQALAIIGQLEGADAKGLRAEDYDGGRWAPRIARLRQSSPPPGDADRARFDLALTVCLMRFISDLHIGRVNPKAVNFEMDVEHKKYDLPSLLRDKFVSTPAADMPRLIEDVEPPYEGYRRLENAALAYQQLALRYPGAQLPVPSKAIGEGELYPALPQLAEFLRAVGDLAPDAPVALDPPAYAAPLIDAVKQFQSRHGLDQDVRLGPATVRAMNVPLSARASQIRLALERWRWAPNAFPQPPIIVNLPEFELRALGPDNRTELWMRVVVGKAFKHRTPIFTGNLSYVVFRPYWNVPLSIQRNELLLKLQRNPGYLAANNYEVVTGAGKVVNDDAVGDDVLGGLRAGRLMVRQKPGPKNSLGLVKFIFPNDHNVYMHDTPSVALFEKSRRDFSHGCIRVQDPAALAVWVLRNKSGWDRARIVAAMNGATDNVQVTLAQPIPVLIVYGTARARRDDKVYFFDDIYGYDAELERLLAKGYPYPGS
jgi:murein L,D-transpeptidase YcbB/YkuD